MELVTDAPFARGVQNQRCWGARLEIRRLRESCGMARKRRIAEFAMKCRAWHGLTRTNFRGEREDRQVRLGNSGAADYRFLQMTKQSMMRRIAVVVVSLLPMGAAAEESGWVALFNGKNLEGWTPKFAGHPVGHNLAETFRVEDGILKASYEGYDTFKQQYGHLFTNIAYSHYILRLEYRFEGKMMADAPSYVNLNSGVMIHSQSPQSMRLEQGFPTSMEFQFLADEGKGRRPTGNVCTPGTNLEMGGELIVKHIVESSAPNYPAEAWVTAEVEVRGSEEVIHRVNGVEVLRYQKPQLDPRNELAPATDLLDAGANRLLSYGHIALQAEGQGVWFRKIELKSLDAR
jgi:hypothetical protein